MVTLEGGQLGSDWLEELATLVLATLRFVAFVCCVRCVE